MSAVDEPMSLPSFLSTSVSPGEDYIDEVAMRIVAHAREQKIPILEAIGAIEPMHRPWMIEEDGAAEWAGRKLREVRDERARVATLAQDWHAQIDEWFEEVDRPLEARDAWFEHRLKAYMARIRIESDGKIKSRRLPSVRLTSTGSSTAMRIDDDNDTHVALASWLEENIEAPTLVAADAIRRTTKVLVSKLTAAGLAIVEIADGWDVQLPDGTFEVVMDEDDLARFVGDELIVERTRQVVMFRGEIVDLVGVRPAGVGYSVALT